MRRFACLTVTVSLVSMSLVMLGGCAAEKGPAAPSAAGHDEVRQVGNVVSVGAPMTAEALRVTVAQVMASPEKYVGKKVQVVGNVTEVCQEKGCWVTLTDAGATAKGDGLFVKFTCPTEANGRVMPMESVGRPAVVEGELVIRELTQDEARHYAEDAGKSPAEIAKIVGPQKRVTVRSPSAKVTLAAK